MTAHWLETSLLPDHCQLVYLTNKQEKTSSGTLWNFCLPHYPVLFPPSHSNLTLLLLVHLPFLFSFLCLMFWTGWCESKASASLQRLLAAAICQGPWNVGESNFWHKVLWPVEFRDLEKSGYCGGLQHDRSCTFLTLRQDLGCWP